MPERFVVVRRPEFVERSRAALSAASDRVRTAYGFPCGNAARQVDEIERWAAAYSAGRVTVEVIDR